MQKLISISKQTLMGFLALLLFSNVTFAHSIDYHICQGELQSVAFFGQKASCSKMMEAEMSAPRSCCDAKKDNSGLVFKQKPCCENAHFIQDNVFQKPSLDIDQSSFPSLNFINDFEGLNLSFDLTIRIVEKVEIPPPPTIYLKHSQEHLQVFVI